MKNQIQPTKEGAMKRRIVIALALIAVLVVGSSMIGGTLAYLSTYTPEIENVFELGELNYQLTYVANPPDGFADDDVSEMPVPNPAMAKVAASEYTFESGAPVLTGHKFLGWANSRDAKEPDYAYDEQTGKCLVTVEYDPETFKVDGALTEKTVYAVWKQMDFTVTFDTQVEGLTVNPASKTVTYQLPYGELPVPERPGYTFLGWTLEADDADLTTKVTADSIVETAADHTLYAQWKPNTYIVHFNANGGTGTMADQEFTYDEKDFLRQNAFTKKGYDFVGWAVDPDAEVGIYSDRHYVSNLTTEDEITLYAIWSAGNIIVTFESGYADSPATPLQKVVTFDKPYGELATAEIMGYKFLGWYTEREGKGTEITKDSIVSIDANHTLYAHWQTPDIDLLLMFEGSGTNNFTTFAKHDYVYDEAITYTGQTWQGKWESFSIRMANLLVGGTYQLKFDAAFSDRTCIRDKGDNTYPIGCKVDDHPHYAESESTETYHWEPTDSEKSVKNYVIEFVATKDTMYWLWELSKIRNPNEEYGKWKPGVENFEESYFDLILDNISLTLIDAYFDFGKTTGQTVTNDAGTKLGSFKRNSYNKNTVDFNYKGSAGLWEKIRIPINGLLAGQTYTVDYTLTTNANNSTFVSYITTTKAFSNDDKYTGTKVFDTRLQNSISGSFSFKATDPTMYWLWGITGVTNGNNYNYVVNATIRNNSNATLTSIDYSPLTVDLPGVTATEVDALHAEEPVALTLRGNDIPDVLTVEVGNRQNAESSASTFSLRGTVFTVEEAAQNETSTLYMTGLNKGLVNASAATIGVAAEPEWLTENEDGTQTLTIPAELITVGTTLTITGDSYDDINLTDMTYEQLN